MMRALYDWTMERASRPSGERWLFGLSIAEATFFPIPPDLMLIPMILADRARAWRLATITTVGAMIGALLGYLIGAAFYETVAKPIIDFYGYTEQMTGFERLYRDNGILIILIGGLTPIPFKVVAIASGVFALDFWLFLALVPFARAPRFFAVAVLLWWFGPPVRRFIEERFTVVFTLAVMLIIGGFVAIKYLL